MSAILAIETSTLIASVALLVDGELAIELESGVNSHSEALIDLIDECLASRSLALADLQTIAVGAGPGSFTGLRIGMATVKGLCFASGVSLTPISSLAALAYDCRSAAPEGALLVPVLDARRKEIFVGFYRDGRSLAEEYVIAPAKLEALVEGYRREGERPILCGDGASKYAAQLASAGSIAEGCRQTPSAGAVAALALHSEPCDLLAAAPTYVRLPEAEIKFPEGNTGGTFSAEGLNKKS